MRVSVKDVESQAFREFKAESVREGLKIGKALTLAMKFWLESKEKKPRMSLLDLKPRSWERELSGRAKKSIRSRLKESKKARLAS